MQTIHCSRIHNFLAAAVLSASLGFAAPVFADTAAILNPDGTLTYLGTLGGAIKTYPQGFNDAGQVAGDSYMADGSYHAFITGPNGMGMRDLGTLGTLAGDSSYASGINDAGQVAGYTDDFLFSKHAFITGSNGVGMRNLGTLSGGYYSQASGINDAGQVAGYSDTFGYGSDHAFITGPNGVGMNDLGTLDGGGGGYSNISGINAAGQLAGEYGTANGPSHAFITGPDGVGMRDLGTGGGTESQANGINDAGQVVGYFITGDGSYQAFSSYHAFITGANGVGMTDLGTLGGAGSAASGINDAGQVVGNSVTGDDSVHAFITGPNGVGMTDLNSLVVNLPGGSFIAYAYGINNHGQILVNVVSAAVVPEPETYAMLLAGLALVGFSARLRKAA